MKGTQEGRQTGQVETKHNKEGRETEERKEGRNERNE